MKKFDSCVVWKLEEIDSTNSFLKKALKNNKLDCAAVWSKKQTKGRGRLDRQWLSPEGGLYFSILAPIDQFEPFLLGISVSVVIVQFLRKITHSKQFFLKWPNDILYVTNNALEEKNERKIGGILSELVLHKDGSGHVIVGIGLNINTNIDLNDTEYALPPISLSQITQKELPLEGIFDELQEGIFSQFTPFYDTPTVSLEHRQKLFEEWQQFMITKDRKVKVYLPLGKIIEGDVVGFSPQFDLLVDINNNIQEIKVGDCIHLR